MSGRSGRSRVLAGSGPAEVRILAEQLRMVPTELRAALRPAIRQAGQGVLREAAARASWSTRIPRALKVQTKFSGKSAGVYVIAALARAPHARAYEGISGANFRHPVFGDRDVWVAQAARPYLFPAARAMQQQTVTAVQGAIDTAVRQAGFG